MKKIILFITLCVLGISKYNCEVASEEVEYKWYILKEQDVHYESNVEDSCEYFDKNNYMYSDYMYSMSEVEKKDGRVIELVNEEIDFNRLFINDISITEFFINYKDKISVTEISFYENGEEVNYKVNGYSNINDNNNETYNQFDFISNINISFKRTVDLNNFEVVIKYLDKDIEFNGVNITLKLNSDITLNVQYSYNHNYTSSCSNGICTYSFKINTDELYKEPLTFKTNLYRYKDKLYKCYSLERIYAPYYYKELEGYIKDEEKYRVVETIKEMEYVEVPVSVAAPIQKEEPIDTDNLEELNTFKEQTLLEKTNNKVAMISESKTNKTTNETSDINYIFYTLLILILVIGTFIIIKNIKKSRLK